MQGYGPSSYGDAFADVYDDWYRDVSDAEATADAIAALARAPHGDDPAGDVPGGARIEPRVLELGVGTGRLAIPLAARGLRVHGLDASAAMLDRLAANDPDGRVAAHLGDMVDDLPPGPFSVVLIAYNTIFNLTEPGRQAACFAAVADRLTPGGRFVVEAVVPDDARLAAAGAPHAAGTADGLGGDVTVRSLAADRVVLAVTVHRPDDRLVEGQFVELDETHGVRLRPWAVRYATPDELDAMAAGAGFVLEHRWRAFDDTRWSPDDDRHVSVYRLGDPTGDRASGRASRPAD